MTSRKNIHIVEKAKYEEWNLFKCLELFALCGAKLYGRVLWAGTDIPWTEVPYNIPPDTVCPVCRDHPEYAMILLAGEEYYE